MFDAQYELFFWQRGWRNTIG